MTTYTATYSPEDNKLRLYASSRLDAETYARVRAAGFIWAPKQELFVAPMWTPGRAALCEELAGDIGDEDTSLVERAEERAERFEDYSDRRETDAERAAAAVKRIADGIPMGQPILVGHHSERHARRDAAKIENGMRKAVKMWETSKYWTARAAGAVAAAKYKERPEVRARRIKKIEAEQRKTLKGIKESTLFLAGFTRADSLEAVTVLANHCYLSRSFPLADYPRDPPASQYEGPMSLWSALDGGVIGWETARSLAIASLERSIARLRAWLPHYENRLLYERAMLEEQGATQLLARKPKSAAAQLPLCNYRAPEGITVPNRYNRGETMHLAQVEMTAAEYAKIYADYKGTRVVGNSHRVRSAMVRQQLVCVFLTDSKVHARPADGEAAPVRPVLREPVAPVRVAPPERTEFDAMKDSLRAGVTVTTVPQLFPTPPEVAAQMIEAADLANGQSILEPSAGTGALLSAIILRLNSLPLSGTYGGGLVAVEINRALADWLTREYELTPVHCADFLTFERGPWKFDRIVMNPPFQNGDDIKHIRHALTMLKPGGRLVALCAAGPRQEATLRPLAEESGGYWERLPDGSFAAQGTGVRVAMVVIEGAAV